MSAPDAKAAAAASLATAIATQVSGEIASQLKLIGDMLATQSVAIAALDMRLAAFETLATQTPSAAKRPIVLAGAPNAASGTTAAAANVKVAIPNVLIYFKTKFAEGGDYRTTYATAANITLVESDAKFAKHLGKSDTADYWKAAAGIIWPTLPADQQEKIRADLKVYSDLVKREAAAPQLEEDAA
jgi:hypothetical protein